MIKILKKSVHYVTKLPWTYQAAGAAVIVVAVVAGVHALAGGGAAPTTLSDDTHVHIASVASLSDKAGPLPVTGKITSVSKASILAVSSGEIVSLSHSLGDYVSAGSVIASFENASQRAAVLQAQGAYDGAKAALAKASGSTALNSGLSSSQAAQSAQNTAVAALAAIRSAYATLDDAVHAKADVLFTDTRTDSPIFTPTVPDNQLVNTVQNERATMDDLLESVRLLGEQGSSADIDASITTAISKARLVDTFLGDTLRAISKAVTPTSAAASTLAANQSAIAAARTQVLAAISALTSAKSAYDSAASGAAAAQNTAGQGLSNDIASAQAQVTSALGALNAAQANLEKTVIRAPISGTIVSLPITRGGYVSSFSQVAQISNPSALEIEAYVTADDAKTLAVGGKAKIEGTTDGVVVFVAPALDPTTGKIQVKVGLPRTAKNLTDGETVSVTLERTTTGGSIASSKNAITIPIVSAKITPAGPVVFTVSSSTLVAVPVTFGAIAGNQVTIESGLTLNMDIVTDARGLSEGQHVVVDATN